METTREEQLAYLHEQLDNLFAEVDPGELLGMLALVTVDVEADKVVNRTILLLGPHRGKMQVILGPVEAGSALLGAIQPHVVDATAPDLLPD